MTNILFLDCTKTAFNGEMLRTSPLGGIESVTVGLAEALAQRGHEVHVVNNGQKEQSGYMYGVHWSNYGNFMMDFPEFQPEVIIANHDAKLLNFGRAAAKNKKFLPVVWLHNRLLLEKTIRKGNMGALLRYRPVGVFLGDKHLKNSSLLHPFRRRVILPHGLDAAYLGQKPLDAAPHPPRAIYFSQAYRGLNSMIEVWMKYIHAVCPEGEFHAYTEPQTLPSSLVHYTKEVLEKNNIYLHAKISKQALRDEFRRSRLMLYPGYKDETFCCAATEALSSGLPVVTYGIGALLERVLHGETGFIAPVGDMKSLAESVLRLFQDDALWCDFSKKAIHSTQIYDWDMIAADWEERIFV